MKTIAPETLKNEPKAFILDVRTPIEQKEVRLSQPHLCQNLSQLDVKRLAAENKLTPEDNIYILCHSGQRAAMAQRKFNEAGFNNAHVVEGGIVACEAAGLAKRDQKAMSLERQVRIAAGSLALLGVILGYAVNAGFYALSGFVGAGLVFAGITNWCGMGLLLARMPWNRA